MPLWEPFLGCWAPEAVKVSSAGSLSYLRSFEPNSADPYDFPGSWAGPAGGMSDYVFAILPSPESPPGAASWLPGFGEPQEMELEVLPYRCLVPFLMAFRATA